MSPALSAYLDAVRLTAALLVFAHHASYPRFGGEWIAGLAGYGHESVVIFFVLSGFVIAFSHEKKDRTLPHYAASRLSRLWSVALPTMALTLLLDAIGSRLSPDTYQGLCESAAMELVASLFFLNQFWVASACLGSNIPYWSLSYEFLYYCLFAVYAFAPRRWLLLALAGLVVGPKVLLLLPCWAFGVVVFSLGKRPLPRHLALLLAAGGLALFIAIVYSKVGNKFVTWRVEALIGPQWTEWLGHSTAFISDTLLGAMFAAHLWGVTSLFHNVSVSRALLSPLQKIASSTFAIYLIHYPCLIFFTALSLRTMGTVNGIFVGLSSLLIPVILTWPTEAFKRHLRRFLLLRF